MNNFIVSARKYRPSNFRFVVGQDYIVTTLKNAIKNNQLAQAFLFCGTRGIGKTTCARILAKTINCKNITEDFEACNECESCVSFSNSASFNIHELDAASNNSVDDIRSLVDKVRIPPQAGKYKIYIIDEVHMLSTSAFNAFLKTLEEPPSYAKFILATTEKHKIIPTILSRCQIFDFKRITVEDIAKHLAFIAKQENIEAEDEALKIIARKSDGSLRDALSIFDQMLSFSEAKITYQNVIENLNILDADYYFTILDHLQNQDTTNALLIINEIYENGFDGQALLNGFSEHLRNLLVCKDAQTVKLFEVPESIRERYLAQSNNCSVKFLIDALEMLSQCDVNYKTSANKRFHIELTFLRIASRGLTAEQQEKNKTTNQKSVGSSSGSSSNQAPSPKTQEPRTKNQELIITANIKHQTSNIKPQTASEATSMYQSKSPTGVKSIIEKTSKELKQESINNNSFTQEELEEAIKKFKIQHEESGNTADLSCLDDAIIKKNSDINYELIVENKVNIESIKSSELIEKLRDILQNRQLNIKIISKTKNDTTSPAQKREEKIKKILENNKPLGCLFKELDLKRE